MKTLTAALVLTATVSAQRSDVWPPSDARFLTLHADLSPKKKGKWEQIPWSVDLLAARRRAVKEKKPLFMWSMNGHPLGSV